jgi:hypothetical protein
MSLQYRMYAILLFAAATAAAYAQNEPAPTEVRTRSDIVVAEALPDLQPALPPAGLDLERRNPRVEVDVSDAPNGRVDPPSNDRRYNPRTKTEWTWQTPQRGNSATGMWPMPGTGGQPGTLQ